jgi:hypothetical protein
MSARWRVYFNRRGAPKGKTWCVDRGEGTRRRYFLSVTFDAGTTDYNGKEPDCKNPVAWINARGALRVWGQTGSRHAAISEVRE